MKWTTIAALLLYNVNAYSQIDPVSIWTDSTRVIGLREVVLSAKAKTQTDHLSDFYRGNISSTLEEVLARLPEVTLIKRGSYGLEPTLRSFSGGQVNIMIDGMRIHGACTDKMDPATIYIEPDNLESFEIQTGNRGFSSGSAIGGSFNFKIEEPEYANGKIRGVASSGFHSASSGVHESLSFNYGTSKFALRTSGTYRKHNNYRSGRGEEIRFSQYEKINFSLGAKIDIGNNFHLRADFIGDEGFNIGYPALPMDVGYASAKIGSLTLQRNATQGRAGLQLKVYGNYIRHFMDDTQRQDVYMHMDMPGKSKTVGFFGEVVVNLNRKNILQLRGDGSSTDLYASMTMYQNGTPPMFMLTWPNNRRNQWGASVTWLMRASEKWSFRFAGRSDLFTTKLRTEQSKDHVQIFSNNIDGTKDVAGNFSAEATRSLGDNWKASISAGVSQRVPSASEQYGFYLFNANDGFDYIGNPDLEKESAVAGELNIQFSKGKYRGKFSTFLTSVHNYISSYVDHSLSTMTHGANGVKRYLNESHVTLAGMEGSAIIPITATLGYVSTIKFVIGKNSWGQPLQGISPLKTSQTLQWSRKKLTLKAESELAAPQARINTSSGEDQTPGYSIFHLRSAYKLKLKSNSLELQCGIENFFDRKYHEHSDWKNIPRQGRNIYVQAKFEF